MSEEIAEQNFYATAFLDLASFTRSEPSWMREIRECAFKQFERVGFPTVHDEEWKYTNVSSLSKANFTPVIAPNGTALSQGNGLQKFIYDETRDSTFVFVNGILRADLSSVQALSNIVAMDLIEAARVSEYESVIRERLESGAEKNGFEALNTALFAGGLFVNIPSGVDLHVPIQFQFISEPSAKAKAIFPRVLIVAKENSGATIIESYSGTDDENYFTSAIVDIVAEDAARIRHYKVQRESAHASHIATTRASLGRNANYDTTTINIGAALSRHDILVSMDHEGASCSVDGLYMVDGNQHTDTHSLIDHRQPHCTSHQLYKGILDGKSRAVFNGKVFVRHGAQQTNAQQTNKNLLLSNEAQVDTKPQLEIFADDVKCAHGAAVGQLNQDELFYLESRGINPALAKNMLTYGFAEEVIEKIKIDSIKRELDSVVLNRLSQGSGAHRLENLT